MGKPRKSTALKKMVASSKKARSHKGGKEAASSPATGTDDIFGFMAGQGKNHG
jgi:hypothetical protein